VLPQSLLQSLESVKGFNRKAFEAVHLSGEQITSIRFNPEKYARIKNEYLSSVNSHLSSVPWCEHGYYLNERPSFTFDPLFHAGAYYVQEASSMFLWEVLKQTASNSSPKKILDLCAAPGGKSTLLASYFTNGLIVSNDVIKSRAAILTENITKWGADHVIVTNNDAQHFQSLKNYFDVIVIDAPCSGSGLFRKDPNAINEWSKENVKLCSSRQQRIVADVFSSLKKDGVLIYSTCSYSKEEDENILDWMMNEFQVNSLKLEVEENWNIIETESEKNKAFGYRFYPDKIKGEGFFIAVFKKTKDEEDNYLSEQNLAYPTKQEIQHIQSFISLSDDYSVFKQNDYFRAIKKEWLHDIKLLANQLYIKKAGVEIGIIKGKDFIPSHELAVSVLPKQSLFSIELDKDQALQYLRRKDIFVQGNKGWNLMTYCGLPLGWAKVLPNRVNNYYPPEWRILKD
jgi:NOL1/NOP2/sun family putative RNA methylase